MRLCIITRRRRRVLAHWHGGELEGERTAAGSACSCDGAGGVEYDWDQRRRRRGVSRACPSRRSITAAQATREPRARFRRAIGKTFPNPDLWTRCIWPARSGVFVETRVHRAKILPLGKADGERGRLRTAGDAIRGHRTRRSFASKESDRTGYR